MNSDGKLVEKGTDIHLFKMEGSTLLGMEDLSLVEIFVPEGVTHVERTGFQNCVSLVSLVLPESVVYIHQDCFAGCSSLKVFRSENPSIVFGKESTRFPLDFSTLEYVDLCLLKQFSKERFTSSQQMEYFARTMNQWENLSKEQQDGQWEYIKHKKKLQHEIFLGESVPLIGMVLERVKPIDLCTLETYLEKSTAQGSTQLTAIYLEYRNKHYNQEEVETHSQRQEMVEMGFTAATLVEFKKKWSCKKKNQVLWIDKYLGSNQKEIIPEKLADGTPIRGISCDEIFDLQGKLEELYIYANLIEAPWFEYNQTLQRVFFMGDESFTTLTETFPGSIALQEVRLPESLEVIGMNGFSQCESLVEITIPENVKELGQPVFVNCGSLEQIHLSDSLELSTSIVKGCPKLADSDGFVIIKQVLNEYHGTESFIDIPDSVKYIGFEAFSWIDDIVSVRVPEGVLAIQGLEFDDIFLQVCRKGAFSQCSYLKEIFLPKSLEKISYSVFFRCESLETVEFQEGLLEIGKSAFENCSELEYIELPESLIHMGDMCFLACISLREIRVPKLVKKIPKQCFLMCHNLVKVELEEGLLFIDEEAFRDCDNLQHIVLPSTLKHLGQAAFLTCESLEEIVIPKNVGVISPYAFGQCRKLKKVILEDGIEEIGKQVFFACQSLDTVMIPETVTYIDSTAFESCKKLTIYGKSGSYAQEFCQHHDIAFVVVCT